jgi:predicted anti-sigma-YlaC factor YlaD
MRCRDAKYWLTAQRDNDLAQSESSTLHEHLKQCAGCRAHEHRQQRLDTLLHIPTSRTPPSVSTQKIMRAVEQQIRITRQLEDLRAQQQSRVARLRIFTPKFAAFAYLTIGLISLSLLALFIFQTDMVVKALALVNGGIDALIVLAQYIQTGLALITRDNWLLSAVALGLVVLMGMWLRLMRYPQEA